MKITKPLSTFLLLCTVFAVVSCSKDGDPNTDEQATGQEVPQSKAEAETKIEGKWTLSGSGDVKSIEFTQGNTYILEVPVDVETRGGIGSGRQQVAKARVQRSGLVAQTTTSSTTTYLTGTYTVSADGKTITLDDIGVITIKNLTADNFTFSVKFADLDEVIEVSLSPVPAVATSDKTAQLVRAWGFSSWASHFFDGDDVERLTQKGYKAQDNKLVFTKSGSLILTLVSMSSNDSSDPNVDVEYHYSLESEVLTWAWKNNQQDVLVLSGIGEGEDGEPEAWTGEVAIALTSSTLVLSNFIGDLGVVNLVPIQ